MNVHSGALFARKKVPAVPIQMKKYRNMAQIPPTSLDKIRDLSVWSVSNRALPGIGISLICVYLVQGRRLPVYALREVRLFQKLRMLP